MGDEETPLELARRVNGPDFFGWSGDDEAFAYMKTLADEVERLHGEVFPFSVPGAEGALKAKHTVKLLQDEVTSLLAARDEHARQVVAPLLEALRKIGLAARMQLVKKAHLHSELLNNISQRTIEAVDAHNATALGREGATERACVRCGGNGDCDADFHCATCYREQLAKQTRLISQTAAPLLEALEAITGDSGCLKLALVCAHDPGAAKCTSCLAQAAIDAHNATGDESQGGTNDGQE